MTIIRTRGIIDTLFDGISGSTTKIANDDQTTGAKTIQAIIIFDPKRLGKSIETKARVLAKNLMLTGNGLGNC